MDIERFQCLSYTQHFLIESPKSKSDNTKTSLLVEAEKKLVRRM
jgi:hypothetical protein